MEVRIDSSRLDVPPPHGSVVTRRLRVSPNPVLAHARVHFETDPASLARTVEVLDLTGRRVATLPLAAGARSVEWQGRTLDGRAAPAGIYFARVEDETHAANARFVLAR
jgi:flagellar hook assembly protein FlgD